MNIKITFITDVLGTWANNPEVARDFIASKAPNADNIEAEVAAIGVDAVVEKGKTVFPRDDDGTPILYAYQISGFFKEACGLLARVKTTDSSKIKAYKKIIDGLIFPQPRKIRLDLHGGEIGELQRPLRAQTAQGERVSLAISETLPAGTTAEFSVLCLDPSHEKLVREWLDYGSLKGIGQWRNANFGQFVWEELDSEGNVIAGSTAA